ncbi:MAG: hypothetical protein LBS62_04755 [Clostridiales bacterium]|jgi:hypothetical protein|nr:hypothetical protein [Clostridiales bacterium]
MLRFEEHLYIGDTAGSAEDILRGLKKRLPRLDIFLLCTDRNSKNFMEIIHSSEIFKPMYTRRDLCVVGIAGSREEAMDVLIKLASAWAGEFQPPSAIPIPHLRKDKFL